MKAKVKAAKSKLPAPTKPVTKTPRHKIGKPRGFAAMKKADVLRIASMGGKTVSRNSRHMALIGSRGGANSHLKTNGRKAREEA